jgi:hypothetical protein
MTRCRVRHRGGLQYSERVDRRSNHVVAVRRGRTVWTGEVHQARCETFRLDFLQPAILGLDPAKNVDEKNRKVNEKPLGLAESLRKVNGNVMRAGAASTKGYAHPY